MAVSTSTPQVGGIRDLRRAAGITQTELAVRAGCSVAYVRQLETGCLPRSSRVLPAILNALNDVEPAGDGLDEKTREDGARHASG